MREIAAHSRIGLANRTACKAPHGPIAHEAKPDVVEFIADQLRAAPEQTYKILSILEDDSGVRALSKVAKANFKSTMTRNELIAEINKHCTVMPEFNRCPHTPDLFD